MYTTGMYRMGSIVLLLAVVLSHVGGVYGQIQIGEEFGIQNRLGLRGLFRNPLGQNVVDQSSMMNVIGNPNIIRDPQQIVQEYSDILPIEEAAKWARYLVREQTHGQLSTFLNRNTAFNESLIGLPVSSVEMFVEDCTRGNGDLLIVSNGLELSSRNLVDEMSKVTLLVQGKFIDVMNPKFRQIVQQQMFDKPLVHKLEVVLVGHMQRIGVQSDEFLRARQCIMATHPEIEILERTMPQKFVVWRFKIDSGIHMVDHMRRFIGWIPLEKYQTVVIGELEKFHTMYPIDMQYRHMLEYPFHFVNQPLEREILSGMSNIRMEDVNMKSLDDMYMRKMMNLNQYPLVNQFPLVNQYPLMSQYPLMNVNEYPLNLVNMKRGPISPFAMKALQFQNMRQMLPVGGESLQYLNIPKVQSEFVLPKENVDINMIGNL